MRVLVTGGAGFIGSHIVEHFQGKAEVRVLDNLRSGFLRNIEPFKVEFIEGSVLDTEILKRRNHPFCPALRRFRIVRAFNARKIQPVFVILPRPEGTRKIRHGTPDAGQIPVFILLCQMCDLRKIRIGRIP